MNSFARKNVGHTWLRWMVFTAGPLLGGTSCGAFEEANDTAALGTNEVAPSTGTANDDMGDMELSIADDNSFAAGDPISEGEWIDDSGTIQLQMWRCAGPPARTGRVDSSCTIPPGYVLVGGGASIFRFGGPGAMLVASYPDPGNTRTWRGTSKDHFAAQEHTLEIHAIGMKLNGLTENALRNQMHFGWRTSALANHPSTTAFVPPGYVLLGGGARPNYGGAGQLLVASWGTGDSNPPSWFAKSKDHVVADPSTITAFTISVKRCPTGYTGGCLASTAFGASGASGFNDQSSIVYINSPNGALTSIGGEAISSPTYAAGRMLGTMFPVVGNRGGSVVWTRDHNVPEAGFSMAYGIALQQVPR